MAWPQNNYPAYGGFNSQQTYIPQMPMQSPPSVPLMQGSNNTPVGFACRPVTSRAEAEVFQIPFDGSTTYFVDTANGKIYAKTFNMNTGAAPIVTFVPEAAAPEIQYATVEQLNAVMAEIEALKKPKKAVKKDEPDE